MRSTSGFLRLWTRAPRTAIQSCAISPTGYFGENPKGLLYHSPFGGSGDLAEPAAPVPVDEIQEQPNRQPPREPGLGLRRQPHHYVDAGGGAGQRNGPDKWHSERTRTAGILVTEDEHADTHDRERGERADIGEVVNLVLVSHEAAERDKHAGDDGGDVRRPVLRMDARRPVGQQAVSRHRHEDARL